MLVGLKGIFENMSRIEPQTRSRLSMKDIDGCIQRVTELIKKTMGLELAD